MSYRPVQCTCNRCFKHFYGEEDLSCHMMMAHRTVDSVGDGADGGRHRFANRGYTTQTTDEVKESIPPKTLSFLYKIERYFDSLTADLAQMKRHIAVNSTEISKLREGRPTFDIYSDKMFTGHTPNESERLSSSETANFGNPTYMEAFAKIFSGQKELKEHMGRLEKEFESQKHCHHKNKEHESLTHSPVLVQVPIDSMKITKKKSSRVSANDNKMKKLLQQVEKEKERSRQLLGINSQLKAQAKLLRSKMRQQNVTENAKSTQNVDQKMSELTTNCHRLSQANASLEKLAEYRKEVADSHITAKNALEEENKELKIVLAKSEGDLQETKIHLQSSQERNDVDKENIERLEAKIEQQDTVVNQMAMEKKDIQGKLKEFLNEVELCRGDVMKKELLEADLKEQEDRCKQLEEKIDALKGDLLLKDTKIQTLENINEEMKCEKETLKSALSKTNQEQVRLSEECSGLQSKVGNLKKHEETLQCTITKDKECFSKLEHENVALQQNIDGIKRQNCELKDSLTVAEEARNALAAENEALKQSIVDIKKHSNNSEQKLAEVETAKVRIEQELLSERKELKEAEVELQEKVSALFDLDAKRSKLDEDNERLEELNAELAEEISGYKELLADYDDLMSKHRQRISEIDQYKAEVEQLRQSEKENVEHLSVLVREGKKLGEEIARIQLEKDELERELEIYRDEKNDESQALADQEKKKEYFESQLKEILQECHPLPGKEENFSEDLNADQMVNEVRLEIKNKNSQIKEMDTAIAKLNADVRQLTCSLQGAEKQEQSERNAREHSERKIEEMQAELDQLRRSLKSGCIDNFKTPQTNDLDKDSKEDENEESRNQVEVCKTSSFYAEDDSYLECIDDFEMAEPAITLNVSDDELFERKPQKIDPEELEADFYDNDPSSCEIENEFRGYLPSRVSRVKEELPSPPQVAPIASSVSPWPSVGRKPLLGKLPPLALVTAEAPKSDKPTKKKTKKKKSKENVTNVKHGEKSNKEISKLDKDDVDDVDFNNNDIANLLDNL